MMKENHINPQREFFVLVVTKTKGKKSKSQILLNKIHAQQLEIYTFLYSPTFFILFSLCCRVCLAIFVT